MRPTCNLAGSNCIVGIGTPRHVKVGRCQNGEMKFNFILVAFAAIMALMFVAGCTAAEEADPSTEGEQTQEMNVPETELAVFSNDEGVAVCPVMNSEVNDVEGMAHQDYEGTRYYFCCDGCPEAFAADPDKYIDGEESTDEESSDEE